MRVSTFHRLGLLTLALCSGCPKSPVTTPATGDADRVQVGKLARVLRTADRRIIDSDFKALLSDSDPLVRTRAAIALGQIGERSSLAEVTTLSTDSDPAVRAGAAFALGLIADPSSEGALEQAASDAEAPVRAAAAEALGRLHDPHGADPVKRLLDDPDMSVRAAASLAAWKFAEAEPLLDPLIANLVATDEKVRIDSSYALARLGSAAVAPASSGTPVGRLSPEGLVKARSALAMRVADPTPYVRMQVARGLASPQASAELAVVGALSKDPDAGVRVSAVRSLGYPGISVSPYLERAISDRDLGVARAALEALGQVGGAVAVSHLSQILVKMDNIWLREATLLSLAHAAPEKSAEIISGLLLNPDPGMRSAAAALIVGRTEPGAIRAALKLLADPAPRVQAAAVPLVAGQEGAISRLLPGFFAAKDPVVRAAVAEAVGERFVHPHAGVESADDLFARLSEIWDASASDRLPDAKLAALDAAAKAGRHERTEAMLTRALTDPEVVVRRRAAKLYQEVYATDRSADIGPATERPLADYEAIVRWGRITHTAVVTLQRPGSATGQFTITLDAQAAPLTAWNFAELAGQAFFDGATVHRVVPNFVVQDGDPRGDGYGGPGYSIRDEWNPLSFDGGVVGMASDGKDTAGSQWFVTLSPQPHLDGRYTAFGRVARGLREIVTQVRPGDSVVSIRIDGGAKVETPAPR